MTDLTSAGGGDRQPRVLLLYYSYTGQSRKVLDAAGHPLDEAHPYREGLRVHYFREVAQEAAARATKQIQESETKLVQFFKDKGLAVTDVDKADFLAAVQKGVTFEQFGYRKADWDAIQAVK